MLVHNTITEGWFGSAYESDRFPKLNTKHGLHRFHDCVFADMMSHYSKDNRIGHEILMLIFSFNYAKLR